MCAVFANIRNVGFGIRNTSVYSVDKRGVQEAVMKIKLNGWQRIGIVLNAIYLIIIIFIASNTWPTQKSIESSWVYSALNAIRKPESPSAYELMEGRFKDISTLAAKTNHFSG